MPEDRNANQPVFMNKDKYQDVKSYYSKERMLEKVDERSDVDSQRKKQPIILNTNFHEESTSKTNQISSQSFTTSMNLAIKSTMTLKNDLKLIRTFKIDPTIFSSLRSEEEKREYLLNKMEEDIRNGL